MRKQITKILIIIFSIICLGLLFYKVMAVSYDAAAGKDIENFYNINIGDEITGINEGNTLGWENGGRIRWFCVQHLKSLNESFSSRYKVENIIAVDKQIATIMDNNGARTINLKNDGGDLIAKFVKALSYYSENSEHWDR